jgi:hypothetical protein
MTSKEFINWLRGFAEACHEYAPTPKQWETLKQQLESVDDSKVNNKSFLLDSRNTFGESYSTTTTQKLND